MSTSQLLEAHNQRVERVEYRPEFCKHCADKKQSLRPRQLIRRLVRFIEGCLVYRSHVFVILWVCSTCHRSFRHLPPFLKRHKRFITPTILEKTSKVLNKQRRSYRKTAVNEPPHQTPILYDDVKDSALSHTSVWRWVQWMGAFMTELLSIKPETATENPEDSFEFSEFQARQPECRDNLYLARRCWMGRILFS